MATATEIPAVITLTMSPLEARVVASLLENVAPIGAREAGLAALDVMFALEAIGISGLEQDADGVWAELNSDHISFVTESP